jgi:predicted nucleotidyltransferase
MGKLNGAHSAKNKLKQSVAKRVESLESCNESEPPSIVVDQEYLTNVQHRSTLDFGRSLAGTPMLNPR